jgi:hypothetical protein
MSKIGKSFFRLLIFACFGAWFTFAIWGVVTWGVTDTLVNEKTTIILLSLLTFIGTFVLFVIAMALGAIGTGKRKKEEEKKFEFTTKDGDKMEFKMGEDFDFDKIPAPFREIAKKIKDEIQKEKNKK